MSRPRIGSPAGLRAWRERRSLRDPNLDHRVDILDSEHPRRPEVSGQQLRLVDLEDDTEACALLHPDVGDRDRALASMLGCAGGLGR